MKLVLLINNNVVGAMAIPLDSGIYNITFSVSYFEVDCFDKVICTK